MVISDRKNDLDGNDNNDNDDKEDNINKLLCLVQSEIFSMTNDVGLGANN